MSAPPAGAPPVDARPDGPRSAGAAPVGVDPVRSPYVLSCAQMRAADLAAISASGLPSVILMENAGRAVAESVLRRLEAGWAPRRHGDLVVAVVCGAGNNGGDGFVVARHLSLARPGALKVRVLMVAAISKLTSDAAVVFRALQALSAVTVFDLSETLDIERWTEALKPAAVIVDAVFGTGLRSDVTGVAATAIAAMNAAPGLKVAVDIPSGLDGDSGRARGRSVCADLTVAVGARKLGLLIDPQAGAGEVEVIHFGVPIVPDPATGPFCFWSEEQVVRASLPSRTGAAHKGTGGHLIVVAGTPGKTGAALLSSRAGLRAGAGLVTIASTAAGCLALDSKVVEAMTIAYSDSNDAAPDSFRKLSELAVLPNVRAFAVGPGIPTGPGMRETIRRLAAEIVLPMVLDADALNLLGADAVQILADAPAPRLVTPHPGEMARLCGWTTAEVQSDRLNIARQFAAASRAVVVLKGARTLVVEPDGTAFMNPAVEPALATAGSGDVLTGVIGGLLSQGMETLEAARAAVFLHGCAGAHAARSYGSNGVIAGDLPEAIAVVRATWTSAPVDNR